MKDKVLEIMREAGKPVSAGDVVKLSGMEKPMSTKLLKSSKQRVLSYRPYAANGNPLTNKLRNISAA